MTCGVLGTGLAEGLPGLLAMELFALLDLA